MAVTFACEKCHAEYTVSDALAGKKGRCNSCGHLMQVPGARRTSGSDSTLGGRAASAGSGAGGRQINFADPLADEVRDIPARAPRTTGGARDTAPACPSCGGPIAGIVCTRCGYNSRTGKKIETQTDDPLGDLDAVAEDGTIPFTEEFQSARRVSLNLGGATAYVSIMLGVLLCLLPLLNQPVINAYGRLPVYAGLGLGIFGAFLLIQKGRGNAGVAAGALTVAAFFGGALYKPPDPSITKPAVRRTTPAATPNPVRPTVDAANPTIRAGIGNLNSFDPAARLAAAQELLKDPPQDQHAQIARAMEPKLVADDPRMRLLAVEGVMLNPTDQTASILAHLAADSNRAVRERTLQALGQLGGPAAIAAIAARLADDPAVARQALAQAGSGDATAYVEAFRHQLENTRDPRLRAIAIYELAARGAPDLVEPLTSFIGDSDPRVRDAAILALGRLKATSAIRAIADKLGETDAAVTALQAFGPAAEKEAVMLAGNSSRLVRAAAARVLITAATPQSLPTLQMLAQDEDRAVAAAALEAWKRLVPTDFTPLQDALRDLTSNDALRQRKALDRLAAEIEPDENRSKVALRIVGVALGDDADLRPAAARALESWGTRDALLVLVTTLGDPDAIRRERAQEVLGHLKDPRAVDPLADLAEQGNTTAVEALAAMGPIAEDGALRLLNCANTSVQLAAVRALGQIGTSRSVAPLSALMRSRPNNAARQEDLDALRRINLRITEQSREEARKRIKTIPKAAPTARPD